MPKNQIILKSLTVSLSPIRSIRPIRSIFSVAILSLALINMGNIGSIAYAQDANPITPFQPRPSNTGAKNAAGNCDSTCDSAQSGVGPAIPNPTSTLILEKPVTVTEYQSLTCVSQGYPANYTGSVSQIRTVTYQTGVARSWTPWTTYSNTCADPTPPAPPPSSCGTPVYNIQGYSIGRQCIFIVNNNLAIGGNNFVTFTDWVGLCAQEIPYAASVGIFPAFGC